MVVDPHPKGRHRRFSEDTLARLEALAKGTPADVLLQALLSAGVGLLKDIFALSNLDAAQAEAAVEELRASGQLLFLEADPNSGAPLRESLVASRGYWERLAGKAIQEVEHHHQANPLRRGIPREELKSRLKASPRIFAALMSRLEAQGYLQETGLLISRSDHRIRFTPDQEKLAGNLMARFAAAGYAPPSVKECQAVVGEDLFAALVDLGGLVQVSPEVVFSRDGYDRMVQEILRLLDVHKTISAAQVRDHFITSRRYVLALLEHMDAIGLTTREGDVRRRKN
jgi:selenocysteine-specific elongation factor